MKKIILSDLDVLYLSGMKASSGLSDLEIAKRLNITAEKLKKYETAGTEAEVEEWLKLIENLHNLTGQKEDESSVSESTAVKPSAVTTNIKVPEFLRRYGDTAWYAIRYGLSILESLIKEDIYRLNSYPRSSTLADLENSSSLKWLPAKFADRFDQKTLDRLTDTIDELDKRVNNFNLIRLTTADQEMLFYAAYRIGSDFVTDPSLRHPAYILSDAEIEYYKSEDWLYDYLKDSMAGPYLYSNLDLSTQNPYHFSNWFRDQFNLTKTGKPSRIRKLKEGSRSFEEIFLINLELEQLEDEFDFFW